MEEICKLCKNGATHKVILEETSPQRYINTIYLCNSHFLQMFEFAVHDKVVYPYCWE